MRPDRAALHVSMALLLLAPIAACGGDDGGGGTAAGGLDDSQVVMDYADQVIIPTYRLLARRAADLDAAASALAADPSDENLRAARDAWVATRLPWEQSEAFLFGPVEAQGYDPAIDTWPLNRTDLQAVLDSDDEFSPAYVQALPQTQKGFHAVEFLLFGEGGRKTAADLTDRELEYLTAMTADMASITSSLETSWTDGEGGQPPFHDTFTSAGDPSNTVYPSLSAAGQEMVNGMSSICDEVANGKIAEPFDSRDPNKEESQFSENSLDDFQNNIRSVQNAYLGAVPAADTSGASLSAWVAARDPDLDQELQQKIAGAIAAIGAIPPPFHDAITNSADADTIEAAQTAIRDLKTALDGELLPLVQ